MQCQKRCFAIPVASLNAVGGLGEQKGRGGAARVRRSARP